ncbi:TolC family protein [Oleiharenicola lentus]|uniref:TolC family protein n=1 Tax=Oleiharenicola lentus TaxID=2508720 RepID=A0A4Q1C697_9BACT|nr:TolC family protein [Oleiharenicola lentus]RXK54395.1 TolC family protein [Oleiharenicola lentus]
MRRRILSTSLALLTLMSALPSLRAADGPATPLTLEQALAEALEHNFAIRQAREQIRQQEGVVTQVTAAALPGVSAAANFQKSSTQTILSGATPGRTLPVFVPSGRYWRMSITARQNLYAGGGIRATVKEATLSRDAATLQLKATIDGALLDVRLKFYAILLARAQIAVEEQNLGVLEHQLRDVNVRFEVGSVSNFERLRAEVAVANARAPLIKARNDHRLAIEELRRAVGRADVRPAVPTGRSLEVVGELPAEVLEIELPSALARARTQRPELHRLARLVEAAEGGVNIARAGFLPTLAVSADAELRKGPSEKFSDSLRGWRAGAQGGWNVASRATAGRVKQAESLVEQAQLAREETELAVQVEVRRAVAALTQANELVTATRKSVEQAEEALRVAEERFKAGTSTQLELLQAQSALTVARTSRLRADYSHSVAVAQLRRAMGDSEMEYAENPAAEGT